MCSPQIQKAFFMRPQTIKCFPLAPHEFQFGLVGPPIKDLPDTFNLHTCPISALDICLHCFLVKNRTEYRCWSKRFPASLRFSSQHVALAVAIDECPCLLLYLEFKGRRGKDKQVPGLLHLVSYSWHRLGHYHQAFPGR